jgi:hypothetical protein
MRESIEKVRKAIKGLIEMSEELEETAISLI